MANILILGAGLVSKPGTQWLLKQGHKVVAADSDLSKAKRVIGKHEDGEAVRLLANRENPELKRVIESADIVISFLPVDLHDEVATPCLTAKTPLITTSYPSPFIMSLKDQVQAQRLHFYLGLGVDPGFDLETGQKIIDLAHAQGLKVTGFTSYCGGLPAPEVAAKLPLNHGFAWTPVGGLRALTNNALFLEEGLEVRIPKEDLLDNPSTHWIKLDGSQTEFWGYPNRDSVSFKETHQLAGEVRTLVRGTLRFPWWFKISSALVKEGLFDQRSMPANSCQRAVTFLKDYLQTDALKEYFANQHCDDIAQRLEAVGFFNSERVMPEDADPTAFNAMATLLSPHLLLTPEQRDMIVMQHKFTLEKEGQKGQVISTFVTFGDPAGDSAMARTVSMPAAVVADLAVSGKLEALPAGIHLPTAKPIYQQSLPILAREADMVMIDQVVGISLSF